MAEGFGGPVETHVGGLRLGGLLGTLRRAALLLGNDSGPRHLAAAVGTPTVAVFTNANSADVVPLFRTWHRLEVSWRSAWAVCGVRVLDGSCGHGASCTADVPVERVRELALDLWEQVAAAGRTQRDGPDPGAAPVLRAADVSAA